MCIGTKGWDQMIKQKKKKTTFLSLNSLERSTSNYRLGKKVALYFGSRCILYTFLLFTSLLSLFYPLKKSNLQSWNFLLKLLPKPLLYTSSTLFFLHVLQLPVCLIAFLGFQLNNKWIRANERWRSAVSMTELDYFHALRSSFFWFIYHRPNLLPFSNCPSSWLR